MRCKIASNTNLIAFSSDSPPLTMREIIPLMIRGGYSALDLNFCELMNERSDLNEKEKADLYLEKLIILKEEYSLEYIGSHLPYSTRGIDATSLIRKALLYAEPLGIKIAVIHPLEGTFDDNLRYFERLLKETPPSLRLAIENMEDGGPFSQSKYLGRLSDHFGERVGICLDTGHLNMSVERPETFISSLGKKIIMTHINDNDGKLDEHLLPGMGTVDWREVIRSLKDNGYEGYLNFEAMYVMKRLPSSERKNIIRRSLEIGERLLKL